MTTRKPFFSGGLSWAAIAILTSVVLSIGVPVIGLAMSINRELGRISTTLERVATDLTDNKSEHQEFREAIVGHDVRLTHLEQK